MPTTRHRHIVTETPQIEAWLDDAARWWPDVQDRRSELVRRLIGQGHAGMVADQRARRERELQAVYQLAGSCPGIYPPDAAEQLKAEWPE